MKKIKLVTPILLPLFWLVVGIYIQSVFRFKIYFLLALLCMQCLLLTIFAIKNYYSFFSRTLIAATFWVVGALCFAWQINEYIVVLREMSGENMSIVARVSDKKILPHKTKRDMAEILCLDVEQITNLTNVKPAFSLMCYSRSNTAVQVGDLIELNNIKLKNNSCVSGISGNQSYQDYLFKEGFLTSIFLSPKQAIKIIDHPSISIDRWFWNLKTKIYNEIREKMDCLTFSHFALIFLGNTQQSEITQMRETFNYWGLSHYLARSGLHIVFFILIWTFLFRFIPIGLGWKRFLLILICLIYKILSWSSVPFIRAFYVFLLTEGGRLFNFQTNFLHLLSVVCMTILIFNPMQLFFLDFQLSFGLTFTLSLALRYF